MDDRSMEMKTSLNKSDSAFYDVESIMAWRYTKMGVEYLVHWKGYGHDDDTWEPASNLPSISSHVTEFGQLRAFVQDVIPNEDEKIKLTNGDETLEVDIMSCSDDISSHCLTSSSSILPSNCSSMGLMTSPESHVDPLSPHISISMTKINLRSGRKLLKVQEGNNSLLHAPFKDSHKELINFLTSSVVSTPTAQRENTSKNSTEVECFKSLSIGKVTDKQKKLKVSTRLRQAEKAEKREKKASGNESKRKKTKLSCSCETECRIETNVSKTSDARMESSEDSSNCQHDQLCSDLVREGIAWNFDGELSSDPEVSFKNPALLSVLKRGRPCYFDSELNPDPEISFKNPALLSTFKTEKNDIQKLFRGNDSSQSPEILPIDIETRPNYQWQQRLRPKYSSGGGSRHFRARC